MAGLELPLSGTGEVERHNNQDTPLWRTTSVYSLSVAMDTSLIMMHAKQDKSLV